MIVVFQFKAMLMHNVIVYLLGWVSAGYSIFHSNYNHDCEKSVKPSANCTVSNKAWNWLWKLTYCV
ncbi:hypothetical protein P20652_3407 [Pseudoalteromonas sp. BSi20652]|nr:hypothetical protein P20652_3407 [Pseudoalteromonas sp. BSi20652]